MARYAPDRGDIVWLEFPSRKGRAQSGRRPVLVLSPVEYNRKVGLAVCCPITSQIKGYPFEVVLPDGLKARGAVLCDQIGSVDWRARRASRLCPAPPEVVADATAMILTLIDPQ